MNWKQQNPNDHWLLNRIDEILAKAKQTKLNQLGQYNIDLNCIQYRIETNGNKIKSK